MSTKTYYEDFEEGFSVNYAVTGLSKTEIIEFAKQHDPQRFHLDETEAAATHFGGLVASGFQTLLLCFKQFCTRVLLDSNAIGAPGIDRLQWVRPWYPGEQLDVSVVLLSKRRSARRGDRGYLTFEMNALVGNRPTLKMNWSVIILTRSG